MDGWTGIHVLMAGYLDGLMNRWMDGLNDGQIDEWMDGWCGWMDGLD